MIETVSQNVPVVPNLELETLKNDYRTLTAFVGLLGSVISDLEYERYSESEKWLVVYASKVETVAKRISGRVHGGEKA